MAVQSIRLNFPSLKQDELFMDNAAGAQVIKSCIDSIQTYYSNFNVQPASPYPVSEEASSRVQDGYKAAAAYMNASVKEIVYGASTTQLVRNVSTAFKFNFDAGDNIVLSKLDHEAHLAGWAQAASWKGVEVRWWTPTNNTTTNPKLEANDLEALKLVDSKTRLVAFTHTSNVLGSISDVAAISRTVKRINPKTLISVDGVAYAPHGPIDVEAFGVDFYFFSWYKVYGPHIATAFVRESSWPQLESLGHFFLSRETANDLLGLSCGNYELIQCIPTITTYLKEVGWEFVKAQEQELQAVLLDYIKTRPDIQLFGELKADRDLRVPVVSFRISGRSSQQVIREIYATSKCTPTASDFYARRLLDEVLGQDHDDGVIRCSFLHYNTVEEVEVLISVLDKVLNTF